MASSPRTPSLERRESAARPDGVLRFRLPALDTSAAEARRRVRRQLAVWGVPEETSDNAQLVVSELVTNALRHTGSASIGCEVGLRGALVRVAVSAAGRGPGRVPGAAGSDEESGRGLLLVCSLAAMWGVRPLDAGRAHEVWAELSPEGPTV
ncbi:ATP-binding protein [Streptomyces sp. RFCAC02]|uniref:ATP-binding protein n=1 Tax=Streptomyces sp. RFCAC02 TaxID=2499143 RepID=UPI001F10EF38|nr:ATP-binding protein [Streptomyces sp. RFCAC02]